MTIPVLTFFNNESGVGKTSLVYNLAWMFAELGKKVIVVDLDPQANLTSAFLDDDKLEQVWEMNNFSPNTIYGVVEPLVGDGNPGEPELEKITANIYLVPGDIALAGLEEPLSLEWSNSLEEGSARERAFRILSSFWDVMQKAGGKINADMILADVGPNLGAINRSALIAANYVIIPLGSDLFSLQSLKNLGNVLYSWKEAWKKRLDNWKNPAFALPEGKMNVIGYITQQRGARLTRPMKAYDKWINRIPGVYRKNVLREENQVDITPENDDLCLAILKPYRSLVPMAQEARKPFFKLTPADGAVGAHGNLAREAYTDFKTLAEKILRRMELHA